MKIEYEQNTMLFRSRTPLTPKGGPLPIVNSETFFYKSESRLEVPLQGSGVCARDLG